MATINIFDTEIYYTVSGEGPALILMHGWGCNSTTLASIERVAVGSNTVYNIDFPGFGRSQEPSEVWDVERFADMLHEFVTRLGIKSPSLLGHSFGGRVAIVYASQWPVDKVILVDAAGVPPVRTLMQRTKICTTKVLRRITPVLGHSLGTKVMDWWRKRVGSSDYANSSPMMRAIMSKCVNEDLIPYMPKISAPTLLIWGENDTATPMRDAHVMERLIPGAGLVSFPGCGHYSFLDNPVQFAAVLRSFLHS